MNNRCDFNGGMVEHNTTAISIFGYRRPTDRPEEERALSIGPRAAVFATGSSMSRSRPAPAVDSPLRRSRRHQRGAFDDSSGGGSVQPATLCVDCQPVQYGVSLLGVGPTLPYVRAERRWTAAREVAARRLVPRPGY